MKTMTKPRPITKHAARARPGAGPSAVSFDKYLNWLHIIIITMIFWLVYSNIFDHKPDLNGDNFAYYLLAKRLVNGQGYTNATEIHHLQHTHFPPGYPLLLAVFMKTVGDDQDTLNFMNGLMMYGSLLLLYLIVKKLTSSSALAFAATFITSLNSHLLRSATITMSEAPFLFISLIAIYAFIRAAESPQNLKSPWLCLSIVSVVICYHTKTTAIALLGGMAVYLIFSKGPVRLALVVGGFVLLCLPWHFRNSGLTDSHMAQLMLINPYNPELGKLTTDALIDRVGHNFLRYISMDIPSGILSLQANALQAPVSFWLIGAAIIALVLWGICRLRGFRLMFLGYMGGTMAILMVWPDVWGGIRFILPLVPIAVFLALYGMKELIALAVDDKYMKYVPYLFLLLAAPYIKPIAALVQQAGQPMSSNYTNYFELAKWAKANTPEDAIFSARKPDMFIYYADRTCIGDEPSADDKKVMDFFRKNKVDYVIIEQLGFSSTPKYLVPAVQKNMDKFDLVLHLQGPDTYLLKFKRDKP